jgi:hypothetical protein
MMLPLSLRNDFSRAVYGVKNQLLGFWGDNNSSLGLHVAKAVLGRFLTADFFVLLPVRTSPAASFSKLDGFI